MSENYGKLIRFGDWFHHFRRVVLPTEVILLKDFLKEVFRFTEGWDPVRDRYTYRIQLGPIDIICKSINFDPHAKARKLRKARKLLAMLIKKEIERQEMNSRRLEKIRRIANLPFDRGMRRLSVMTSSPPIVEQESGYELWTQLRGWQKFATLTEVKIALAEARKELSEYLESRYLAEKEGPHPRGSVISRSSFVPLDARIKSLRTGSEYTRPMTIDDVSPGLTRALSGQQSISLLG